MKILELIPADKRWVTGLAAVIIAILIITWLMDRGWLESQIVNKDYVDSGDAAIAKIVTDEVVPKIAEITEAQKVASANDREQAIIGNRAELRYWWKERCARPEIKDNPRVNEIWHGLLLRFNELNNGREHSGIPDCAR